VAQLVEKANRKTAWEFLEHMLEAVPPKIHTILTELSVVAPLVRAATGDGIQFAEQPRNRNTVYSRPLRFDMICAANEIEHRMTKPNHPWTNGHLSRQIWLSQIACRAMVERMNRTMKDATVKRYHHDSHDQLRSHLADFLDA